MNFKKLNARPNIENPMNAQGDNVSWLNLYWKGNKIDEGSK